MITFELAEAAPAARRVVLVGRLDSAGAERVGEALAAALGGEARHVVIDLSAVPFVGSLGIRVLVSLARRQQRAGRGLALYGVQPRVLEVFETVALGDLMPLAGNETEAIALLA